MERIVCYCRVSTDEEKQLNALQKQIEELENFVNQKIDWQLIDTYVDEGKSGTTTKGRLSYQKLYADLLTDKFDTVLIKDQSRLMRNVLDWYQFLDRLVKSGKRLYLYLDNCYYTPNDKFITGIKAMMAEEYSRDLSKKITSAARRSQKKGTVYGNGTMLGYKQVGGKLEIIPEEAEIVKQIFAWYAEGIGCRKILYLLKERGITSSNGTDFSATTLKRMLKNEKYKGLLVSHKTLTDFETKRVTKVNEEDYIIIPNGVPAIISEELWDKCNKIRQARVDKYKQQKSIPDYSESYKGKYVLSGKIICDACGKSMWHDTSNTQNKYKVNENVNVTKWSCRTFRMFGIIDKHPQGCESTRIYDREIIACLQKVIFDITSTKSSEDIKTVLQVLKSVLQNNDNNTQIKSIENQITQLKIKSNKLLDILLDGTIDKMAYNNKKDEIDEKIKSLNNKLNQLKSQTNNLNSKEARLRNIEDFLKNVYEKPENIPLELISNIVRNVRVCHNKQDSEYNYTVKVILNLSDNDIEINDLKPIYKTTYNFTKQRCRTSTEEWEIIVCA